MVVLALRWPVVGLVATLHAGLWWDQGLARSVNVGLTAGEWRDSPAAPLSETVEFLSLEGDAGTEKMWKYIELFDTNAELASAARNLKSYAEAREVADAAVESLGLGQLSERLLEASLHVRAHLPSLEMHYSQAELTKDFCQESAWAVVLPLGAIACTPEELKAVVEGGECGADSQAAAGEGVCRQMIGEDQAQESLYDVDHEYPAPISSGESALFELVVYGRLATPEFYALHNQAKALVEDQAVSKYVFRHAPPAEEQMATPLLQGYGVWLDIKNMEYKNLDEASEKSDGESSEDEKITFAPGEEIEGIYFSTLLERKPELARELNMLRTTLMEESTDKQDELKVWNMGDLGIQATQSITQAQDPLHRFQEISQNFPLHASALSSLKPSEVLREEVMYNMQVSPLMRSSQASLYVNGQHIDCGRASFNFFQALEAVRVENQQLSELVTMGVPPAHISGLLAQGQVAETDTSSLRINVRKDSKGALLFLNNIERDKEYKQWPKQLEMLMYPSWQPTRLRFNLYTIVVLVDPSNPQDLEAIETLIYLHTNQFPLRIAIVLAGKEDLQNSRSGKGVCENSSADLAQASKTCQITSLFLVAKKKHGMMTAMNFLMRLNRMGNEDDSFKEFTVQSLVDAYGEAVKMTKGTWSSKTNEAIEAIKDLQPESLESIKTMANYITAKGLTTGMYLLNGIPVDDLDISTSMMHMIMVEQQMLGQMVMMGEITPTTKNFLEKILKYHGAHNRWHPMLTEESEDVVYAPLHTLENVALTTGVFDYVHHVNSTQDPSSLTVHVVSDFTSEEGLQLMTSALTYINRARSRGTRVAFLHRSAMLTTGMAKLLASVGALFASSYQDTPQFAEKAIEHLKHEGSLTAMDLVQIATMDLDTDLQVEAENIVLQACKKAEDESSHTMWQEIVQKVFKIPVGMSAVFANGRKVEVSQESPFTADDFQIIAGLQQPIANGVLDFLTENKFEGSTEELSDLTMRLGEFLAMYWAQDAYDVPNELTDTMRDQSFVSMKPDEEEEEVASLVTITAAVDPLSVGAQRLAPLLVFFRDQLGLPVKVSFFPSLEVTELPFKNFYRFILSMHGSEPHVRFQSLPRQHILTARLDTPEIWNVQASKAIQDMDNLRCDSAVCGDNGSTITNVEYNLKNMIVVGQCYDWVYKSPPNGLQLVLNRPGDSTPYSDTLVMKNLGYYQLKARPGIWHLNLAEGRAQELYNPIDRDTSEVLSEVTVIVRDFHTRMNFLAVSKRPGMEHISLLDEGAEDSGYWASVTNFFGGSDKSKQDDDDTIHVFSLATGHLYERMLKIMMLSVVKRSSMKVKFWLFENFLSPTFKDSALAMAEDTGFEVDFVTYKWPEWLRHQSEKQRIIWGYKILFLDVLFPLNVKKVIYVDADQVVRADLKELWEMDLKGKPYGYTPFCTSRKETLGYQFWNSGFWKDHLGGKPYHISALYVVDLQMFRRMMVGDQLRGMYDALSRDPNSLANLDQDLPNYAQHQIPIFSLPQEWLWCETWCSDTSKSSAKTIDLCNNPQHKEPKLDMARRVISGDLFKESWIELDEEVKSIEAQHNLTAQH